MEFLKISKKITCVVKEDIDPKSEEEEKRRISYGLAFFERRKRKGFTEFEAIQIMRERNHFGAMMVDQGDADAMITGLTRSYRSSVSPAIRIVGLEKDVNTVSGMYILNSKRGLVLNQVPMIMHMFQ